MANTVFPLPTSSTSTSNTKYVNLTNNSSMYSAPLDLPSGVYTVTMDNASATSRVILYSDSAGSSTVIDFSLTAGQTRTLQIGTDVKKVWAQLTNNYTDVKIAFTLTGTLIANTTLSGVLTTYSTSQTVSVTAGTYFVIAVGGGGGGVATSNNGYGGGGGGAGGLAELGPVALSGNYVIQIGSGANGAGNQNSNLGGGTTNFGNLIGANGGYNGGDGPYGGNGGPGGSANGTYTYSQSVYGGKGLNGGGNQNSDTTGSGAVKPIFAFVNSGKTLSGGRGGHGGQPGLQGNAGYIGLGGSGSYGNGTGYGAGGGGGNGNNSGGSGMGTSGVIYLLKVNPGD
jgi:hypothetical protein